MSTALLVASLLAGCGRPDSGPQPPRHVFILLIDTLRTDRVGWYGGERGVSPFLDELAERGGVFWRAYVPAPWTSPTVASLFTSRYPSQHGITQFTSVLHPSENTLAEELKRAGYATAGFSANKLVNAGLGYSQGFDTYRIEFTGGVKERAERLHADALDWIDGALRLRGDAALFLYLHYMEAHEPLQPPAETLRAVAALRGRDESTVKRLEQLASSAPPLWTMDAQTIALAEDLYDAEITSLDHELRRFFQALDRRGLLKDAVIIVTADHGEEFLDHGAIGHGHTLYEELIRVPLLIALPGQSRRLDVTEVVSLVDVAPTILDAVALPAPVSFEGRSRLAPLRRSWFARGIRAVVEPFLDIDPAYSELSQDRANWLRPMLHARALVGMEEKLIERRDAVTEAYDLAADPYETNPAGLPPARQRQMHAEIEVMQRRLEGDRSPRRTRLLDDLTRERMRALGYDDGAP